MRKISKTADATSDDSTILQIYRGSALMKAKVFSATLIWGRFQDEECIRQFSFTNEEIWIPLLSASSFVFNFKLLRSGVKQLVASFQAPTFSGTEPTSTLKRSQSSKCFNSIGMVKFFTPSSNSRSISRLRSSEAASASAHTASPARQMTRYWTDFNFETFSVIEVNLLCSKSDLYQIISSNLLGEWFKLDSNCGIQKLVFGKLVFVPWRVSDLKLVTRSRRETRNSFFSVLYHL